MNTLIAEELRIGNFTLDCNLIVNYFTKKNKQLTCLINRISILYTAEMSVEEAIRLFLCVALLCCCRTTEQHEKKKIYLVQISQPFIFFFGYLEWPVGSFSAVRQLCLSFIVFLKFALEDATEPRI